MSALDPSARARVASYDTVEQLVRGELLRALGGIRGAVEAGLPTLAFVVAWWWGTEVAGRADALRVSLVAAGAVMAVLVLVRIAQRQTVQHVLSGVVALVLAAVFAMRTGRPSDFFLLGILYNAGLAVLFLGSVAVRWPVLGLMFGALVQDPAGWRARREELRLFQRLTLVFSATYVLRVAVQLPLYLVGAVTALGVAKLVMGWPLLALAVVAIGALLARGRTPLRTGSGPDGGEAPGDADAPDVDGDDRLDAVVTGVIEDEADAATVLPASREAHRAGPAN